MPYDYLTERDKIFTEEAQKSFLVIRDNVHKLLRKAGAVRMLEAAFGCHLSGDS